jgi:hypothetical protein
MLLAHAKAICFRQSEIGNKLFIRYGLAGDVSIPYNQIKKITYTTGYKEERISTIRLGLLRSLESYSVAIELNEPVTVETFYGIKKKATTLLVPIDHPREFVNQVEEKILQL